MKQTKHILLTLVMLLFSLAASAHDFAVGGIFYNITSSANKRVEVTFKGSSYDEYWDEYSGSITIPAMVTYEGVNYSVTSIGVGAFDNCTALKEVIFEDGSETLSLGYNYYSSNATGQGLFYDCPLESVYLGRNLSYSSGRSYGYSPFYNKTKLTSVVIGDGVTSIGNYAFHYCSSLTTITLPTSVTSIEGSAFYGCSSLTSITIPEGVTSIGGSAFWGCSSLTAITIPEGVTSIEYAAFRGCRSLTTITLPESVTSIGDYAFQYCSSSLTSITIPESVTSIGDYAFQYCRSLTSITIPESVTSIGSSAFSNCSSLTSITLPESVTSIGDYAFQYCSSLTSITIPEGVTSIGSSAFSNCSSLTAITIPESVTSIGSSAFRNCTRLLDFYSYSEEVPLSASDAFSGTNLSKATLYVPTCALSDYKRTAPWSGFGEIKGMTIEGVEIDGICYNLITNKQTAEVTSCDVKYAGDIIIPSVVTYDGVTYPVTGIGDYAFSACTGLFSVILPECLTSIGADAFSACYLMASIRIPENVVSIGSRAFYYCISLTSVVVPESVQVIDDSAFEGCGSLSSVSLSNGLNRIGSRAFANCDNLLAVYCSSESVPVADADAFANSNLAHATLYVPSVSISVYRSTAPWSSFGSIEDIDNAEMGIGLLQPNSIGATIYDLTGRKLHFDNFNELPEGIYIIDGRKIIVKKR